MNRHWLLSKNGVIVNKIIADQAFIDSIKSQYTRIVEVFNIPGEAGPGYLDDGNLLTPPSNIPTDAQVIDTKQGYIAFGNKLLAQISLYNDQRNLTDAQRFTFAKNFQPYQAMLQNGDLKAFVTQVAIAPKDGVIVTQAIIDYVVNLVNQFLAG